MTTLLKAMVPVLWIHGHVAAADWLVFSHGFWNGKVSGLQLEIESEGRQSRCKISRRGCQFINVSYCTGSIEYSPL